MAPVNFKPLDIPTANTFNFASSFDGTDIPPPPPSPPPQAKSKTNGALSSHPTTPTTESHDVPMKDAAIMPPPAKKQQISPTSPTSTNGGKRPSSVRKLLSLKSLREKDRNSHTGTATSPLNVSKLSTSDWDAASRPGSPYGTAASIMSDESRPSLAPKRSSAWFGSRRKSGFFGITGVDENAVPNGGAVQPVQKQKRGPPPPTIPEFKEFGSINGALSGGSLGAEELFKDIK
jgi:hypothetical protein